jgi:hypothetical protein
MRSVSSISYARSRYTALWHSTNKNRHCQSWQHIPRGFRIVSESPAKSNQYWRRKKQGLSLLLLHSTARVLPPYRCPNHTRQTSSIPTSCISKFLFHWIYIPIWALAASMKLSVSLQLLDLGELVGLLGWVIRSSQGFYLYTNTEKLTHNTVRSGIRTHDHLESKS